MSLTFKITNYPTGISPSSVAIGDLNGDGQPDLVTTNIGGDVNASPLPAGTVSVLLGNGGGTYSATTPYPTGSVIPLSVAIGDLNGDGKLDLAVANYGDPVSGVGTISVFPGAGDGTFSAATQYPTGTGLPGAQSVAIGDLNGDGRLDLVVADASNRIPILLGQVGGGFLAQTPLTFLGLNNLSSVAIADLNGDGRLDLALANYGVSPGDAGKVSVLIANVGGGFSIQNLPTGTNSSSVAIGDLNGDGHLDLAVANAGSNTVSVLLGNGTGSFSAATPYATGTHPLSVAIGDLNGDGRADLAVANHDSDTVSVLLGNAGGGFQQQTQYQTGVDPDSVAIGDLNGDGRLDLAVANLSANNVTVLLNRNALADDDFNGDLNSDILWRHDSGQVYIWEMNGLGITAEGTVVHAAVPNDWHVQDVGDFNGDSNSDILWRNDSGQVYFWEMDGLAIKAEGAPAHAPVPTAWHIEGIGDFDGDLKSDILWRHDSGQVYLWEMDGLQIKAEGAPVHALVPTDWHVQDIGDYNGDGKSDILWRHDSGQVYVWEMNGLQIAAESAVAHAPVPSDWHILSA
jgi:hypothetical protein